ncbi:MAG: pyridoxamine 5'-phosphate oxidase family protein [Leptolyngbya sp. SIO1D8]|nr:pyridoxamine 5'-phosphate oxidase family protein [Leptolyngbya sp. SIO1D8]
MGKRYSEIPDQLRQFIEAQKIFFVGTATANSRVNISPKGMDSLRVLDANRVVWLNVTGSGNETSAHVQENPRMTLMFAAFLGDPMILRLYGEARVVHQIDPDWQALFQLFPPIPGARQIFDVAIDLVQTSCGMGVPFFEYREDREQLNQWAIKKGEAGLKQYWIAKNQVSLDGQPTHILEKNVEPQ